MAKTFKRLYPKIYDFENLYNAYLKARRGKRDKPSVLRFADNLEAELIQLQNELIWHEYSLGEYHCFKDPGPPVRNIAALPFRDRVVQHAIVSVIEPIWESRFVFDSYACRKGKGSVAAVRRAQYFMRTCRRSGGRVYALQSDIQSYFDSIPHAVVKRLLGKRIACRETLDVIFMIVDSATSLFGRPFGIVKGSLTSQLIANIVLHELDEFVKYRLRERFYLRYMDDFVIMTPSKRHAGELAAEIREFLSDELHLVMHPRKTKIYPIRRPFGRALDFCGYRIWPTHIRPRKKNVIAARRSLGCLAIRYAKGGASFGDIRDRIMSFLGYTKHCNAYKTAEGVLHDTVIGRRD